MKKSIFLLMALTSFMILTVVPVFAEEGSSEVTAISGEITSPPGTEIFVESTKTGAAIHLGLEKESDITVNILKGKKVIFLYQRLLPAGMHTLIWEDPKGPTNPGPFVADVKLNGAPFHQEGFMKEMGLGSK